MRRPNILFYIYMDDIIFGSPTLSGLQELMTDCLAILKKNNFRVAPEKVQSIPPFKILGSTLSLDSVSPAKPQLLIQETYTLTQLQKMLGKINWLRPWISVPTEQLTPLNELLKGLDLSSQVTLSPHHLQILHQVQQAINTVALRRFDPGLPVFLSIFPGETLCTALLAQDGEPIHWVHLLVGRAPRVYSMTDQIADCIIKGRDISVRIFGTEPHSLIVPFKMTDFTWLQKNNNKIAIALEGFLEKIDCHSGPYKWMSSFSHLEWRPPTIFQPHPNPEFLTVFTNGGCFGASIVVFPPLRRGEEPIPIKTISREVEGSAQFKELFAVVMALDAI